MSDQRQPEILHSFEKFRTTVQAYITEVRGRRYAHIREFVEPRDAPGAAMIPTRACRATFEKAVDAP